MSISPDPLFKPFSVNNLRLPNRIVMAPMTRSFSPGGVPGPDVAAYYRHRAENHVGLIVRGVSRPGSGDHEHRQADRDSRPMR